LFQEEEETEMSGGSPRGLERNTEIDHVTHVEPADSAEEDEDSSNARTSKLTDVKVFEQNMKLIEKRLLNMERKISLVIPLLRKALKDEV